MKSSKLEGKTIKRVAQTRRVFNSGPDWVIEAVEFTDGTWLRFQVLEADEYGVAPIYPATPEKREGRG